jgi:hypothetical protein
MGEKRIIKKSAMRTEDSGYNSDAEAPHKFPSFSLLNYPEWRGFLLIEAVKSK